MAQANAPAAGIEYTIYTFDMPAGKESAQSNKWKKHNTLSDMDKALTEAQSLHATEKFHKIEVKKKFFDQKTNRTVDMTLKVFETAPKRDFSGILILGFAILCGVGAFALTYFLGQG